MKNIKLSFALIVATLTISITIATKANFSGRRVITACFSSLQIQNAAGTTFQLATSVACATARAEAGFKPIINSAAVPVNPATCNGLVVFCCAKVTEMAFSDPLYPSAPFIDLGEGLRKYKIAFPADVLCKVQ